MADEMKIELKRLLFFAHHGLYSSEKKYGGEFEVNLSVSMHPMGDTLKNIKDTVNYELLYELVKKEMQTPRELLETLAMDIAKEVHALFPAVSKVSIEITKLRPPMPGFSGSAAVTYSREF
jgi:dihydroneopterin aldolase